MSPTSATTQAHPRAASPRGSSRIRLLALCGALVITGAWGCGSDEPAHAPAASPAAPASRPAPASPSPQPAKPARKADKAPVDPRTPGEQLRTRVAIPEYYPSDGPVYPGGTPSFEKLDGSKANLMFGTEDDVETAVSRIKGELKSRGWKVEPEMPADGAVLVSGTKGSRRAAVFISVVEKGSPSEITMIAVSVDR